MGDFCPDAFWNSSLTWNTDTPQFTECFEQTLLASLPAFILLILAVFQLRRRFNPLTPHGGVSYDGGFYTKLVENDDDDDGEDNAVKSKKNRHAISTFWSSLFVWKVLVVLFLISVEVAYFVYAFIWLSSTWSSILGTAVEITGLVTAVTLIIYDRFLRRHTSGALFSYFLLFLFANVIKFYDALRPPSTSAGVVLSTILLFGSLLAFLPHIFADTLHRNTTDEHECPERRSSFISRLTFSWMGGLMFRGWRRPLVADDLWTPLPRNRTDFNVNTFEREWAKECKKYSQSSSSRRFFGGRRKPSVFFAAYRTIRGQFWLGIVFMCFDVFFSLSSPQLLKLLMTFVEDPNAYAWKGYFYSALLFCTAILQSISQNQYLNISYVNGMNLRSAMMATVYRKALRISNDARRNVSVGEIVNLMSIDAQRVLDFMVWPYTMLSSPLLIAGATYFLWQELGLAVSKNKEENPKLFPLLRTFFCACNKEEYVQRVIVPPPHAQTLATLCVMLAIIPVSMTGRWQTRFLLGQMKWKDERIRIMSEVLSGIKVLKLYAWELPFIQRIANLRENEIRYLLKAGYLQATMSFFFHLLPYLSSLAGFAAFVLSSPANVLTAQKAFVSLTLINIVRPALGQLPAIVTLAVQLQVAFRRIDSFLTGTDIQEDNVLRLPASNRDHISNENATKNDNSTAVILDNATLSWSSTLESATAVKCELTDINMQIRKGELIAVVGHVGAGKTSLCSALLGLMNRCSGRIEIQGSVAYVPQQPWIQHMTVRGNILFAQDMNQRRYAKVLRACALESDLLLLPAGDGTEIGEKGLNLSGGQKQRVSLARAAYSNSDVIILDDPLSAVDSHVAKHIFHHLLSNKTGLLRNKTRILVTHNVSFLPEVDRIVVLDEGRVTELGTYRQLIEKGGAFAEFLRTYVMAASAATENETSKKEEEQIKRQQQNLRRTSTVPSPSVSRATSVAADDINKQLQFFGSGGTEATSNSRAGGTLAAGELVAVESAAVGNIQLAVYTTYLRAAGYKLSIFLLALFFFWNVFMIGNNIWLSEWSSDAQRYAQKGQAVPTSQTNYRLAVYGALGAVQAVFMLLSSFYLVFLTMRATATLHQSMLARVMHAPMSFFDTTPSGRLLNRFSKDVDAVDIQTPRSVRLLLVTVFYVVSFLITICYSTPLFALAVIPIVAFYATVQRFYASATRQLRRLESVARSPIYSLFSETITGQAVIMATMQQRRFIQQNERNIDLTNIAYYPYIQAQRWLNFLLGMLSATIVLCASLFALSQRGDGTNSQVASSMIGLAISNALMITTPLNLVVSSAADVEMSIVSAERIDDYARNVPQEADWTSSAPPPPTWPTTGSIEFKHYATRYRPELELVLRDLTADIGDGERLGIVGRTGAGKSSLALALFRLIEASSGSIIIDGIDISQIGLHELRSRLAIIPQDPVLFSGTLRSNLDPTEQHSDDDVWLALEQAHLKQWIVNNTGSNGGLSMVVQEEGQNLSVGQRQLVCLARALLRKSRILVLDEATAAIDVETDELIQQTIRTEFRDSTVLTVAHRLNTILDYDRVMVLAQGRVLELDSPAVLLTETAENGDADEVRGRRSEFAKMVRAANIAQDRIDMAVRTTSTNI